MSELERQAEYEKCWGVRAITRESFLAAYADAYPWNDCRLASELWARLHDRTTHGEEIDEDPPRGVSTFQARFRETRR